MNEYPTVWKSRIEETECGRGSTLEGTIEIRKWLPYILDYTNCSTFLDLGCGDLNWIKTLETQFWSQSIHYIGVDLKRRDSWDKVPAIFSDLREFSMVENSEQIPEADITLIKDVFIHLSNEQSMKVLKSLKTKYLISTTLLQYHNTRPGMPNISHKDISLLNAPFNKILPEPVMLIKGAHKKWYLGLWEL